MKLIVREAPPRSIWALQQAGVHPLLAQLFADLPGKVECGELAVREETRGLLLPTAIFARWSR